LEIVLTESISVSAEYREKLRLKHLAMEPSLQGKTISFRLNDHAIAIGLPTFSPDAKWLEDAEAEADTWDRAGNVLSVYIYAVTIVIENLTFAIPTAAAEHRHVNTSLFSALERDVMDREADKLYLLARQALDLFIRTTRWKAGLALLDLDRRPDNPTFRGGRLYNLEHGGSFYSPKIPRVVSAPRRVNLTPQIWQSIGDVLASGSLPPIWVEFLASAERRIETSDLREGLIDLAIGAEAAIRQFPHVSKKSREDLLSRILDNWESIGFPSAGPWFTDLRILIQVRNRIMHAGTDDRLNIQLCAKSLIAVQELTRLLA
jgi:hypothetical protein